MADDVERSSSKSKVWLYFWKYNINFCADVKGTYCNLSLSENYSEQYYCFYKHLEKPFIVWACANAMLYLMFCCNNNKKKEKKKKKK